MMPSTELHLPRLRSKPDRLLVIDIENKPGTYGPGDFTHGKVTALGAMFTTETDAVGWVLHRDRPKQMRRAAAAFASLWEQADVIVGHNIRRHDIDLLRGLYTGLGLPLLPTRRTIDTYHDTPKIRGLSRSLENLAARWGCPEQKIHLSEFDWESAYDGIEWAEQKMHARVTSDVRINAWLLGELHRRNLLRKSGGS